MPILVGAISIGLIGLIVVWQIGRWARTGWLEYQLLADEHVAAQDSFEDYSAELIRGNQDLQQEIEQLTVLYQLSSTVSSTTNLGRIYTEVANVLQQVCPYDCFLFLELDQAEKMLVVKEIAGLFSPWRIGDKIQFNHGLIGRNIALGQAALIDNIFQQNQAKATIEEEWFKSLLIVPVSVDGQLLASIVLARSAETSFNPDELAIVQNLGCQIGLALHRAWLYQKLQELAITDGLTGLYNRRYLEETLRKELSRADRYQLVLSVVLLDVDHFKQYNDNNGHQAGDKLLQRISAILKESTREIDVVARYGGEEFILVLPETTTEAAWEVAERIRQRVNQLTASGISDQPLGLLSISAGIATYPTHAHDSESLIKYADTGLYQAKLAGRNQIRLANLG